MKHRTFAILLVVIMLIASSGAALAQGENPPRIQAGPSLATQPVVNGDFEQGRSVGWAQSSDNGWPIVTPQADLPILPHSGNWAARLGVFNNAGGRIFQYITVPNSASLRLFYWIDSQENCNSPDSGFVLNGDSGPFSYEFFQKWDLCSDNNTNGWVPLYLDLSAHSGQTLNLAIGFHNNDQNISNLYIDDVSFYGTFADVPYEYWAENYIQRMYDAGITGGCGTGPLTYCPEGTVTRAQMAVFLLRGIHTSAYTPPAIGAGSGFGDVPPNYWSGAWIKQLAAEGITAGCGIGKYCPEHPVTRAQMAVFLLRSKHGTSYVPPDVGAGTGFGDVQPDYWAAAWIKQLVAEGITSGCGNGNYCPEQPVTRAQMAVFLVRTFSLP